jgi:hypothetical protein
MTSYEMPLKLIIAVVVSTRCPKSNVEQGQPCLRLVARPVVIRWSAGCLNVKMNGIAGEVRVVSNRQLK